MIVTIDGPAASGKSSVARRIARETGFYYLCTGLIFRALAYIITTEIGHIVEDTVIRYIQTILDDQQLRYEYDRHLGERVFFKNHDITDRLKTPEVDAAASQLATNGHVRELVTDLLRIIAQLNRDNGIVVDGRDTGSYLFPDAEVKIFLTADERIRAYRWINDLVKKGITLSIDKAQCLLHERDVRDRERKVGPLVCPDNAVIIDNSLMTIKQTVDVIVRLIKKVGDSVVDVD